MTKKSGRMRYEMCKSDLYLGKYSTASPRCNMFCCSSLNISGYCGFNALMRSIIMVNPSGSEEIYLSLMKVGR